MNELFSVPKSRLIQLLLREKEIEALEAGGVDCWSGYSNSLIDAGFFDLIEDYLLLEELESYKKEESVNGCNANGQ